MSDDILELLKTAPEPPMSIDPYAAMVAGGRARVRRRRLLTVAAAAAAIAVGTGSALVAGRDTTLPAGPLPTSPTPSTTPRGLTTQVDAPGRQLTASLDPATTTITVRGVGDGQAGPSIVVPVPPSVGAATCRVSPALLVQACAVRAAVRDGLIGYVDPTTPDVTAGFPAVGRFAVPDVSVVLITATAADLPSLRGAAWELDDGTVADSSGAPVPQAHGRVVPVKVFVSALNGSYVMGIRPDSAGGWAASGPADFAGVPNTGMGDATGEYYAYLLPPAAVAGEVVPPASATVDRQEVLVIGGRKVLLAQLSGVKRHTGPSVQWVDKDGGVHDIS